MMIVVYNMEAKSHLLIANLRTFFEKYEIYLYELLETRKWRAYFTVSGESREIFKLQIVFFIFLFCFIIRSRINTNDRINIY